MLGHGERLIRRRVERSYGNGRRRAVANVHRVDRAERHRDVVARRVARGRDDRVAMVVALMMRVRTGGEKSVIAAARPGRRTATHVPAAARVAEPCQAPPGGLLVAREHDLSAVTERDEGDAIVCVDRRISAALGVGWRGWELWGRDRVTGATG